MSTLSRRQLLKWGAYGTGAMMLAACAPKEEEAPAAAAPVAAPTKAPEKKDEKIVLRMLTRQGPNGDHHREFAKRYADSTNGKVEVETSEVPWGEVAKTLETQYITGTMVDATWGDNAWWPRLGGIGAYLVIEPYVEASDMDLSQWFNLDWFRRWTDGKLSGLGGCAGSNSLVTFYNKEWVQEAWGKLPEDGWTIDDYTEAMTACVDLKGEGYFGEVYAPAGGHSWHGLYRRWGEGLLDKEGTTSMFASEDCQAAIKWAIDGLESGIFPPREDQAEGAFNMWMAGKTAFYTSNPGASQGMVNGAKDNGIDLGVVIGPTGKDVEKHGTMVHSPYTNTFGCYSGTKYPQEAFDLIKTVSSKESMVWLCLQTGKQPGADLGAWRDPQIAEKFPWFPKVADILEQSIGKAWFPMPLNTRYSEWKDQGDNEIPPLVYGDIPYNQANIDAIDAHTQEILDLPAPPKPNK